MNITLALIISFAVSLVVTAALGYVLIPVLHKLKFGQNILTDIGVFIAIFIIDKRIFVFFLLSCRSALHIWIQIL